MPRISEEELAKAERVLNRVREAWLNRPGVTAIDLGFRWQNGRMTDVLAIRVHVAGKRPPEEVPPGELFPPEIDGYPVDVLQASYSVPPAPEVQGGAGTGPASPPVAEATARSAEGEAVYLGTSVSNPHTTAGTLGAKVLDLDGGHEMIMSNWHVFAGTPDASAGLPIWQPGRIDGGTEASTIAFLSRWLIGPYDAAVARLNGARPVLAQTADGQAIEQITVPLPGMTVWKVGRTTGYSEGIIDGTRGTVPLLYPQLGTTILLQDVFRVLPLPGTFPEVSLPGDSGSVWVDKASGRAVGLHCAGETGDEPEYGLAHDIGAVTRALFVRLPGQRPARVEPVPQPAPAGVPTAGNFWQQFIRFLRAIFRL